MKISRYGNSGFGGKGQKSSARAAVFRKKYNVGDILQGELIQWAHQKLGWVIIEDQELLANIQTHATPGDILTFLVQQLYPDIILKEVDPDHFNEQGQYHNPSDVTREFVKNRAAFQSQASRQLMELAENRISSAAKRRDAFLAQLEKDTKSAVLFFKTVSCAARLNSVLNSTKLFYMPWLVPSALNQEIVLKVRKDTQNPDNSFYELLYALDLSPSMPLRFRIMYKKPQCGFKMLADDNRLRALLNQQFKTAFPEFIGVEKIPPHSSGGFLSELLNA